MRHLPGRKRILQMLLDLFLPINILKSRHNAIPPLVVSLPCSLLSGAVQYYVKMSSSSPRISPILFRISR